MKFRNMDYIEAHRIVNNYIDEMVRLGKYEKTPFYRKSAFSNTKEEILCAYFVYLAVGYRYGGGIYPQQLIDAWYTTLSALTIPWVDDSFANEYRECERILNDKSFFGRLKYRAAIPFVEEKRKRMIFDSQRQDENIDEIYERIIVFRKRIYELINKYVEKEKTISDTVKACDAARKVLHDEYCQEAYKLIGINLRQEDVLYFYPMPILYKLSTSAATEKLFTSEQKRYIERNKGN